MAAHNFRKAMKPLLAHEGGFSNHPRDRGGATMKGVIQRVYDGYRRGRSLEPQSVQLISDAELMDIYKRDYWDKVRGDDLPAGVDYCVFDGAVNSGPGQAAKWLQRALRMPQIDGNVGDATIDRARETEAIALIDSICDQRLAFMQRLDNWDAFGKGWTIRVRDVRRLSKSYAGLKAGPRKEEPYAPPPVEIEAEETGKALPSDTKTTETPAGNVAAKTLGGGIGAMILTWLGQASDYLSYLTGLPSWLMNYIIVGATLMAIAGVITFGVVTLYDIVRRKRLGEGVEAP
jgi:lysozyme family protein